VTIQAPAATKKSRTTPIAQGAAAAERALARLLDRVSRGLESARAPEGSSRWARGTAVPLEDGAVGAGIDSDSGSRSWPRPSRMASRAQARHRRSSPASGKRSAGCLAIARARTSSMTGGSSGTHSWAGRGRASVTL
jgi:hypothetical protein